MSALLAGACILQLTDLATKAKEFGPALSGRSAISPALLFVTIIVNDPGDTAVGGDGICTLREAITNANNNSQLPGSVAGDCVAGTAGLDNIQFDLGAGTPTINIVGSQLPTISDPVSIDGNTGGAMRVELNGAGATGTYVQALILF